MARIDRDNPTIAKIARVKPHKVLAYCRDGECRTIPTPPTGRGRWEKLARMLDTLDWERLELVDSQAAVLDVVMPDGDDEDERAPDRIDDVRELAILLRDTQRDTLREARMMYDSQLRGMADMLATATDAMRVQREGYEMALKLQASALANQEGPEGEGMAKLLQMAMMMGAGRSAPRPAAPTPARPVSVPKPA